MTARSTTSAGTLGIALLTVLVCAAFQFFNFDGKAFGTQPLAPRLLLEAASAC